MSYWIWLILGMFLMGLEIFLPSFTALWFGLGALGVGILVALMPGLSLTVQVMIWSGASILATAAWFGYFRNRSPDRTKAGMSHEALVGETGHVVGLPNEHRRGTVRFTTPLLGSDEWEFICDEPLQLGDRVTVIDLSGNSLIVRPG